MNIKRKLGLKKSDNFKPGELLRRKALIEEGIELKKGKKEIAKHEAKEKKPYEKMEEKVKASLSKKTPKAIGKKGLI